VEGKRVDDNQGCVAELAKSLRRAAVLLGICAERPRFHAKRQRKKTHIEIRGLNKNCLSPLKNLFKTAAVVAPTKPSPSEEFYAAQLVFKEISREAYRFKVPPGVPRVFSPLVLKLAN